MAFLSSKMCFFNVSSNLFCVYTTNNSHAAQHDAYSEIKREKRTLCLFFPSVFCDVGTSVDTPPLLRPLHHYHVAFVFRIQFRYYDNSFVTPRMCRLRVRVI